MGSKSVYGWFQFADKDLALAEYALSMRPQPFEAICYHCQQASEKYLKGYLLCNGLDVPPKTHDLVELQRRCSVFDDSFDRILDECEILTQYGIHSRYPDEIYIDEGLTRRALDCAKRVKAFEPLVAARQALEDELDNDTTTS